MKKPDDQTLRCARIRGGTVACSPWRNWKKMKTPISTPKKQNSRMILQLFHSYVVPPHCSASSRLMMAGINTSVPKGSKRMILCTKVSLLATISLLGSGKNHAMTTMVTAPTGRLIKKHHRHVAWSVNAPPINGPDMLAKPYMLPMAPE